MTVLPGFQRVMVPVGEVTISARVAGTGTPLLLLHGYPQTSAMWDGVAPGLAESHSVVVADLRGYGDSSKPPGDAAHVTYSKRAMAADQVRLMATLGHERFAVAGHDRGGRVAHRMALDHPHAVTRMAVLDIVPTHTLLSAMDRHLGAAYYHWFFLSQPAGLPERLIGHDRAFFLRRLMGGLGSDLGALSAVAFAEYERCFDEATVHASCEDYRASLSIDFAHDGDDVRAGRMVRCPLLCAWGTASPLHEHFDVLRTWRERGSDVRGCSLPCGHYLVEELPERALAVLREFFSER